MVAFATWYCSRTYIKYACLWLEKGLRHLQLTLFYNICNSKHNCLHPWLVLKQFSNCAMNLLTNWILFLLLSVVVVVVTCCCCCQLLLLTNCLDVVNNAVSLTLSLHSPRGRSTAQSTISTTSLKCRVTIIIFQPAICFVKFSLF